jgi:hypothetical protein
MTLPAITPLPTPPSRTDDSATFVARADAFLGALPNFQDELDAFGAAIPAEVAPANFIGTSASSVAIGTGAKNLATQTGLLYFAGQHIVAVSVVAPTEYMVGRVTSYNAGTGALVMESQYVSGSGTRASWNIGPTPAPAANFNPRAPIDPATSGTITPTADAADIYILNGLTGTTTIGAPVNGQTLTLWIKDSGSARTLNWNAIFRVFGSVTLPTATTAGKWMKVALEYNAIDSKWDVMALSVQP